MYDVETAIRAVTLVVEITVVVVIILVPISAVVVYLRPNGQNVGAERDSLDCPQGMICVVRLVDNVLILILTIIFISISI